MEKGRLLREGKTKKIYEVSGKPSLVIIENKNDITKNDDPTQTRQLDGKAVFSTIITCIVFRILRASGIPVAYEERFDKNSFLAKKCEMVLIEVVVRRHAVGSYLLRFPEFKRSYGSPYRFEELKFEVFLKTTSGIITSKEGKQLRRVPVDSKTGKQIDDPLIFNPMSSSWILRHPKLPSLDDNSFLCGISREDILPSGASIEKIETITRQTFLIVEEMLSYLGLKLIDFKIEFGIGPYGELLLADVIDNDSWRLRTADGKELSKELFRENRDMKLIEESYEFVAKRMEKVFPVK